MYLLAQLPVEELRAQMGNGLILMVLGMAIVFLFLTILVFTTKSVSKVVKNIEKKAPKADVQIAVPTAVSSASVAMNAVPASGAEVEIAAAIVAAVAKSKN